VTRVDAPASVPVSEGVQAGRSSASSRIAHQELLRLERSGRERAGKWDDRAMALAGKLGGHRPRLGVIDGQGESGPQDMEGKGDIGTPLPRSVQ